MFTGEKDSPAARGPAPFDDKGELLTLDELEKRQILLALDRCRGNRTHAARKLGISIRTLRNKLRAYRAGGQDEAPAERAA